MNIVILILSFLAGSSVGSFLNVVIYRLHKKEPIVFSRSRCPHCRHILGAIDLIPLLSFLFLRGSCRYCKKPFSWQYPLVELSTGILFSFFTLRLLTLGITAQNVATYAFSLVMASGLLVIFVYDLLHYLILNVVTYPLILFGLFFDIFVFRQGGREILLALLVSAGFFALLVAASSERWMGWGDVKLGILVATIIPWPNILAVLFCTFILGSFVSIILVATKKKKMSDVVPFGTFLSFATIIFMMLDADGVRSSIRFFLGLG